MLRIQAHVCHLRMQAHVCRLRMRAHVCREGGRHTNTLNGQVARLHLSGLAANRLWVLLNPRYLGTAVL